MSTVGNLICLTPIESYAADLPRNRNGVLGRLERKMGPYIRSPGIAFPYLVGYLRQHNAMNPETNVVVQHDKIEGTTPFTEILESKVDLARGDHDVLFITGYTNSAREAYRRSHEARAAYKAAGKKLTVVLGGAHASACPDEGTRRGHVDSVITGEGEWAAAEILSDIEAGREVKPLYKKDWARIRDKGSLNLDMGIWQGLSTPPQQILASTHFARGCKLDCHFCGVFLTNGPNVRNRDVEDIVDEIRKQGQRYGLDTLDDMEPGVYNSLLKGLVKVPFLTNKFRKTLVAKMGPGFTDEVFFWDDNLYNAHGPFLALCEALKPLERPWGAELTIDLADKPELLKAAYDSGCRNLFLGIESISQSAIDGLDKWSNNTGGLKESVKRVHDAGINILGAFVFGLDGDGPDSFDQTLEFIYTTGIDFVVANIIQPYPGTGTFKDALAEDSFLPWSRSPVNSDVGMDYNWPLFDGAHVITQPKGMTVDQLQNGYYYFLKEAYSMSGIRKRYRGTATNLPSAASHFARNYLVSRYGMAKTAHAIKRSGTKLVEEYTNSIEGRKAALAVKQDISPAA
jgi:radical SAM superfamily enzyme YgiQ (UPF0313 family)